MTEYNKDGIPIYRPSEEDTKYFEEEEQRVDTLLRKKKTKRMQPFKDLIRDRTTPEQGLTMYQLFSHIFPDVFDPEYKSMSDYEPIYKNYMRRLIRHVVKTDDDFRWLSPVPYRDERGKIKEYRWVNIKARDADGSDSKLLEEVNDYWLKRMDAIQNAMRGRRKMLQALAQIPETEHDKLHALVRASFRYENSIRSLCHETNMNELVKELHSESRLQKLSGKHWLDYKAIARIVEKELLNKQIMQRDGWLNADGKPPEFAEVRQSVKDAVAIYCNHRRFATKLELPNPGEQTKLDI